MASGKLRSYFFVIYEGGQAEEDRKGVAVKGFERAGVQPGEPAYGPERKHPGHRAQGKTRP